MSIFPIFTIRRYARCFGRPDRDLPRLVVLGRVNVFTYNEICFDSASVVARIGAQIGVAIDTADVLKLFHGNRCIGQFSKGAALRFREMAPEQQWYVSSVMPRFTVNIHLRRRRPRRPRIASGKKRPRPGASWRNI
jgi:hypothetical protein